MLSLRRVGAVVKRLVAATVMASREPISDALLWLYRLKRSRHGEHVQSVLHVSIVSHKQYMLSRAMRARGVHAEFLALNTTGNDRLWVGHDHAIPMGTGPIRRTLLGLYYLWAVFPRFDVIHYHFNAFLFPDDGFELPYLKKMGKLVVFHFRGCDLRCRSINEDKNPFINCCKECDYPAGSCDTDYQRARIATTRRFGDLFLVTTPDLKDFFPEAHHVPFILPTSVPLEDIAPAPKPEGVFRIVTSSNHPGIDGVAHIRAAVEFLRENGHRDIDLIEVVRQPFRDTLAYYRSADLYVGKLLMGYYNNANIETMALGVPNVCYIRPEFVGDLDDDLPIMIATPATLAETLADLLRDRDALKERGLRSMAFVERYHSPEVVLDRLFSLYQAARKSPT